MQFAVAWQRVRQLQEEDVTLDATVVGVNRGGLLVDVANLRGFIPTSHVSVVRHCLYSWHTSLVPAVVQTPGGVNCMLCSLAHLRGKMRCSVPT